MHPLELVQAIRREHHIIVKEGDEIGRHVVEGEISLTSQSPVCIVNVPVPERPAGRVAGLPGVHGLFRSMVSAGVNHHDHIRAAFLRRQRVEHSQRALWPLICADDHGDALHRVHAARRSALGDGRATAYNIGPTPISRP